jgi:diphthine synthase
VSGKKARATKKEGKKTPSKKAAKPSLTFIGLGLHDELDLSRRALRAARSCTSVFAEFYTSVLAGATLESLETALGRKIRLLDRTAVEKGDEVLEAARSGPTCLLVVGDAMAATTHIDLQMRARREAIPTAIIHGASVLTAVPGLLGLQHYKFGRTTTLPLPEKGYFPDSPYGVIFENHSRGLHTLVLLDIQADRNWMMTANEGLRLLSQLEGRKKGGILRDDALVCVVARAGSDNPVVRAGPLSTLAGLDFGPPPHSIVVPGKLHFMEAEALVELAGAPRELLKEKK